MTISAEAWARYIKKLAAISRTAARKYEAYLNAATDLNSAAGRKRAIDYAAALAERYGEGAAAAACEMYDGVAAASRVIRIAAEPAAVPSYGEVAKTVNGMLKQELSYENIGEAIGRLARRTGTDTAMHNAIRDHAEWAWIPSGDSCAFCLTLASNGWQDASESALKGGHAEHIHNNCDCTYAIRFSPDTKYAGYDPDKYRDMYYSAEGDTWRERVNSMRRDQYERDKDEINARKRELYAEHKEEER